MASKEKRIRAGKSASNYRRDKALLKLARDGKLQYSELHAVLADDRAPLNRSNNIELGNILNDIHAFFIKSLAKHL